MVRHKLLLGALFAALLSQSCSAFTVKHGRPYYTVPSAEQIKKSAVGIVVVDMQDHYLQQVGDAERNEELAYQLEVLDIAGEQNIPVFVLEYDLRGSTTKVVQEKLDGLSRVHYFTKKNDNGFIDTPLKKAIDAEGVDSLLIMGSFASRCVLSTARGALEYGFVLLTSRQLISDKATSHLDESVAWFKERAWYSDNYKDLLLLLRP